VAGPGAAGGEPVPRAAVLLGLQLRVRGVCGHLCHHVRGDWFGEQQPGEFVQPRGQQCAV